MFEQSMIPKGRRKTSAIAAAVLLQALVVGLLVLIPLMYVQALPTADLVSMLVAPPPPPPPPPPPAPVAAHPPTRPVTRHFDMNALIAPKTMPTQIAAINDIASPPSVDVGVAGGVPGGVAGGQIGGVLGSVMNSLPSLVPPPPPAAPVTLPASKTPALLHVGGNVQAALLVMAPQPVYPILARQARVQGTVELKAVIGKDGRIQDLSIVSGNPLLVDAAMNAVKQWVYKPTYLNGQPVQVATEIDVHFRLG
jgi:protein TonB